MNRLDIRLALPSKGILQEGALELLAECGLKVFRPNPRQYAARMPALPEVTVLFQRPSDIVLGVQEGSLDFGITGLDVVSEKKSPDGDLLLIHEDLGFGPCQLSLAIPEESPIHTVAALAKWAQDLADNGRSLRVATKFPHLTRDFLDQQGVTNYKLISSDGTLEIAPAIGFADLICDLVSSGVTLRDNHLRPLNDGLVLRSQACLVANQTALQNRPEVLHVARQLIEYLEAHARAQGSYLIIANMRGDSPQAIAAKMFSHTTLGGLQGPTISPVVPPDGESHGWYAINIVVRKDYLFQAIAELRAIGGSGVIVSPLTYIFEEEPTRYRAMLTALNHQKLKINSEN